MANVIDISHARSDRHQALLERIERADGSRLIAEHKQWLARWSDYLMINRGLSIRTAENYLAGAKEYLIWRGAKGVKGALISVELANEWMRELYLVRKNEASSRAIKLSALRQFAGWLELVRIEPMTIRAVRGPKRPQRLARRFSDDQLRRLFAAIDTNTPLGQRDYALLMLMLATGARREEAVSLRIEQIELSTRVGFIYFFGKGAKERVVKIDGEAVKALQNWLAVRSGLEFICDEQAMWISLRHPNRGGQLQVSSLNNLFKRYARRAGIRALDSWPHKMRATFCTLCFDAGLELHIIQGLMGHSDVKTTMRYLAVSNKRLEAAIPSERLLALTNPKVSHVPLYVREKRRKRGLDESL